MSEVYYSSIFSELTKQVQARIDASACSTKMSTSVFWSGILPR